MPDCTGCGRPLGRARLRCYRCGACDGCCECKDGADTEGFNPDQATFDRDELGDDPEED
jgi:hypothetical protein